MPIRIDTSDWFKKSLEIPCVIVVNVGYVIGAMVVVFNSGGVAGVATRGE